MEDRLVGREWRRLGLMRYEWSERSRRGRGDRELGEEKGFIMLCFFVCLFFFLRIAQPVQQVGTGLQISLILH